MSELKVRITVQPRILYIAAAVINAANEMELDVDMLITSGNDGEHMKNSKHYSNEALDFRSKHLTKAELIILIKIVRRRLGKNYQIVVESDHLHIEYDPV